MFVCLSIGSYLNLKAPTKNKKKTMDFNKNVFRKFSARMPTDILHWTKDPKTANKYRAALIHVQQRQHICIGHEK